jgi:hypothetical protein
VISYLACLHVKNHHSDYSSPKNDLSLGILKFDIRGIFRQSYQRFAIICSLHALQLPVANAGITWPL